MPWFEQIFLRRFHFRPVRRIPHLDPAAMPEDLETLGKNADSYFHPLFGGPLVRQPLVSERKFPSETGERRGHLGNPGPIVSGCFSGAQGGRNARLARFVSAAEHRHAEAELLFKRALAIGEKALGPEHPDIATRLNNLAELYRATNRHAEAEPLFKRALAIDEKVLPANYPDLATVRENYAVLLDQLGGAGAGRRRGAPIGR
jgi:tetratricopeptide (TPR) repeat protein